MGSRAEELALGDTSASNARFVVLGAIVAVVTAGVVGVALVVLGGDDDVVASSTPATIASSAEIDRSETEPEDADGEAPSDTGDEEEPQTVATTDPPQTVPAPIAGPLQPLFAVASSTRAAVPVLRCGGSNRFDAELLIDGTLDFGWGPSANDGTGEWIQIDFGKLVTITEIGLTPGYLRVAPRQSEGCADVSAFGFNRFVNSVRYQFDDGSVVAQTFLDQAQIQWISVDPISTQYVFVEILGTNQRLGADDDTILSEIEFQGYRE